MMKNITLGQFMPGDSVIHKLDPRCKLGLTLAYIIGVFLVKGVAGYLITAALVVFVARLARIPIKYLARGLKPLKWIVIFTAVLNLFMTGGEDVLVRVWKITITMTGLRNAFFFTFRLAFLVLGTSVLTLTTSPIVLTDALERIMSPLKVVRFPAHEIAMMMTIALRFIPTLTEEAQKILNAQSARGADFESGSIFRRAKAMVPLLVPLFVSAFRRAGDLAMAMEARCYHGGEGRTRLRVLKYSRYDLCAVGVMAAYIVLVVLEGVLL
ncbi:MAG: energy-coupling factor transporter transmembrane component T [Clostridiales bacterium]|nr:energy-coupling factor transporter transmembrane component T [Clostridiales bacterium]MDY2833848.1 energy-coupling factor transporter transmembrane component T [Candidatus Aphodomonas sp.]